jgi:hypothetical protein
MLTGKLSVGRATLPLLKLGCGVEQLNVYDGDDIGGGCDTRVVEMTDDCAALTILVPQPCGCGLT